MKALGIWRHFLSLQSEQWLDRDELESVQRKKLEKMAQAALETSHYSQALGGMSPQEVASNIEAIPLTEKAAVRNSTESFIRKGAENMKVLQTSGTSGIPLRIHVDQDGMNYRLALVYLYEIAMGRSPLELFAEVSSESYRPDPILRASGLFRKLLLPILDHEEKNFSIIRKSGASVFKTLPSVLMMMSALNERERHRFKSIISHAEILTPQTKRLAEDSFSCPVHNHYGALEVRSIAWTCPEEGRLHVNGSSVIAEIVDRKGRPKKSGSGEIVITSLHNRAMPFLRYRIGDFGSWGKECACGRGYPVLKSLEGRTCEFIRLPSGRVQSAAAMGILSVESALTSVLQYRIIQEREDLFVIRYVPSGRDISEETRVAARSAIIEACSGEDVSVEFERAERIPRGSTGKINRVISKVGGLK